MYVGSIQVSHITMCSFVPQPFYNSLTKYGYKYSSFFIKIKGTLTTEPSDIRNKVVNVMTSFVIKLSKRP